MAIDQAAVQNLAKLAQIHITESEAQGFAQDLSKSIEFIGRLVTINANAAAPMVSAFEPVNGTRADTVQASPADRASILALAPEHTDSCFVVPRILE